ncbi:MAG: hypothetical protein EOM08_01875 [Clostridia bacterium]|nr:hypothetical protein [Clostridia bacterium]
MNPPPKKANSRPARPGKQEQLIDARASARRPERSAGRRPGSRPNRRPVDPVERLMRIERRKARSRAIFLSVLVLFIMLVMAVLILVVMRKTKPNPQFLFIQKGKLTHYAQGNALILRDDSVAVAPSTGQVKPLVTEGMRVSRGQKLALVIPSGLERQLDELDKCEQDIVDLQLELMNQGKGSGARAIYNESAVALSSIVNLVRGDVVNQTLRNLPAYQAAMTVIMEQRSGKLAAVDFHDARLDQLLMQKQSLEQSLGLSSGTLASSQPGIISFHLDGLEDTLGSAAAENLTFQDYQNALEQAQTFKTAAREVGTGEPVLRVTSSLEHHLAFYLDGVQPADLPADRRYTVVVPSEGIEITNCRLVRVEQQGQGSFAIFRSDRRVEWFSDRRSFAAELAVSETEGMRIPRVSLIDFDSSGRTASILMVTGGYTRLVPVKIVDYDREYAIIDVSGEAGEEDLKPSLSSVIVANPESIGEGEFIGG